MVAIRSADGAWLARLGLWLAPGSRRWVHGERGPEWKGVRPVSVYSQRPIPDGLKGET